MSGWTVGSLLEAADGYLRKKGSSSPGLDADLLLAAVLGVDRVYLYTDRDRPLEPHEVAEYRNLIARRGRREPVAYILGRAHFRHLVLEVTPAVLIPRPETEELVDLAIEVIRRGRLGGVSGAADRPRLRVVDPPAPRTPGPSTRRDGASAVAEAEPPLIADVGCGSGAIALSLAQETGLRVLATDNSGQALTVALRNARLTGLEGFVEFKRTDLLEGIAEASLSLVVSNPPYIASGDIPGLEPDVRCYEPLGALEAGADGLEVFRRLLPQAFRALTAGGSVVVEVGDEQAPAVVDLAKAAGFLIVAVRKDLSGKERFMEASLPSPS